MGWKSTPQRARWYGEVIYDNDGETVDAYAYSAARDEPDPEEILPANMRDRIIESKVQPTPNNEAYEGPQDDN